MEDWDDYDLPFADPAIRREYEAALGRFILAHNEVDYRLGLVLNFAKTHLGITDKLDRVLNGGFAERANILALLQKFPGLGLPNVSADRLGELNTIRNHVAHGHFSQHPFTGSFEVVSSQKRLTPKTYTAAYLDELSDELAAIAERFCAFSPGSCLP